MLIGTLVFVALATSPALAFDEVGSPASTDCVGCHGTSPVAADRKGPHGGYTTGTRKCSTCHTIHDAPATGVLLLPADTIKATCEVCHDGTGGQGVYGVLVARGVTPGASHDIEQTNVIPGGDYATGGDRDGTFSAADGNLTCSDCHSPHDAATVEPFTGDRWRTDSDATSSTIASNRLLRATPVSGSTTSTVYGSNWCGSCHSGRLSGSAGVINHPVETETVGFAYDTVQVITAAGASTTETGTLGGTNRGYVMPITRTAGQSGHYPICQQCHEDARSVGDVSSGTLAADGSEDFTITDSDGNTGTDNPRFQSFPHESENAFFLVETADDLCLNCHVPPG
ncbi:MAG: hypothetical protein PF636_09795 [Actinomycetota bacterium]|nr:hypothetical protein [Actinomycetota bacterium]